jgi:FkbM family methyltransferase
MEYNLNIIDIGTNLGIDFKNYPLKSNIYSFEPNPICYNYLKENFKNYSNLKLFNSAVGDLKGIYQFNLTKDTYSSSLLELNEKYKNNKVLSFSETIMIDVINLNDIIEEENINEIDFYKSDTQGYDLKILKSLGENIRLIKKGRIEVVNKNNQIYKGQDNYLDEVALYLQFYNFKIKNFEEIKKLFEEKNVIDYDLKFVQKNINYI